MSETQGDHEIHAHTLDPALVASVRRHLDLPAYHFSIAQDGCVTEHLRLSPPSTEDIEPTTMERMKQAIKEYMDSRRTVVVPDQALANRIREAFGEAFEVVVTEWCPPGQVLLLPSRSDMESVPAPIRLHLGD